MSERIVEERSPLRLLIAGTGRSGTTWLGKIIDSNPHLFYKSQPDDCSRYPWFRGIPSRLDPTEQNDRFCRPFIQGVRSAFWSYSANIHNRPDFPKSFLRWRAWQAYLFALRAWRKISRGRVPIMRIPRCLFSRDPNAVPLVIKSVVSNLRLGWIHHHFPDVKILLIVRHAGGYLNSVFEGAREYQWSDIGSMKRLESAVIPFHRPEHRHYADVVERVTSFERELIYWIVANEAPMLDLAGSPRLKVIVYEELCERPLEVAQDIFRFIGFDFDESTRRFLIQSTAEERPGYHDVYKNPLRAANKWREELDDRQIAIIERYLSHTSLDALWPATLPTPVS